MIDCLGGRRLQAGRSATCVFAEKHLQSLIFSRIGRPTNRFDWWLGRLATGKRLSWLAGRLANGRTLAYPRQVEELLPNASLGYAWHHLSHVAAAFVTSPFERSAFLCVDGNGKDVCATVGVVRLPAVQRSYTSFHTTTVSECFTRWSHFSLDSLRKALSTRSWAWRRTVFRCL